MENKKLVDIELNKVPIQWDLDAGKVTFFGLDSTLFWTHPSLSHMLSPIVDELGADLFCLLVAYSSSLGTKEDYHAMISTFSTNFADGFVAWGHAVSVAGWGAFELVEYNQKDRQAVVIVKNAWELIAQKNIQPQSRWGAPFLKGKLIGIFSHALQSSCWAIDTCHYDAETPYVEIKIFQSNITITSELNRLRLKRMQDKERELMDLVERKTAELQSAKDQLTEHSLILEKKVEERTANLLNVNLKLEEEITSRKRAEEKLIELNNELLALSYTDKLTGIANRRQFDKTLLSEWNRAIRTQTSLCLIIADVDFFKKYNDTYGHHKGDVCLQSIAKILGACISRETDLLARYGGEEFGIILSATDEIAAASLVKKMMIGLQNFNSPHMMSDYERVTMSFGIVAHVPQENQTLDLFFKTADDALYTAKNIGRNNYVIGHYPDPINHAVNQ